MLKEFRDFINRGNVIDLATAVIIGAAFTAIVNSLVQDIIMPLLGIILNGLDFTMLSVKVGDATLTYGNFIQAIVNFLFTALVVFLLVRSINQLQNALTKEKETEPGTPAPTSEELLAEIRDLLKAQQK